MLIKDVQSRLRRAGFDPGPIDGRLGPRTKAALRQFQAASGLPVTGRVEHETLAVLDDSPRMEEIRAAEGRRPDALPDQVSQEDFFKPF